MMNMQENTSNTSNDSKRSIQFRLRIPELEPYISKDAYSSYSYARYVIKSRWEIAEPVISKDAFYSYCYAKDVIKGRFILGEPAISQDAQCIFWYAINIIKGRLPDFMHNQMILENNTYTKKYVKFIQ